MKKGFRTLSLAVAAAALVSQAVFAGGAQDQKAAASAAQPVKLKVWMAGSGDPVNDRTYRTVLDAFTAKNPSVSYELTFIPWPEYFTKLNTGLVGGAGPDVFMLGYGQMGTVQANGNLLALDPYIPADWDGWKDILPNILSICKKDGKMQALFTPSTRVYFYRKDIAKQQGVTDAELKVNTPDDLYKLARKLTVRDPKGGTLMSGLEIMTAKMSPEQQLLMFMSYVTDKPAIWNEDLTPNFNSEAAVKAMGILNGLFKDGVSLRSEPNQTTFAIQTGSSAMSMAPEANYGITNDAFPGQIGILDSDLPTLLIGNYIAVNSATKHKAESVKLLLHMFSKESGSVFAKGMGQYSGRKSLDAEYASLNPEFSKVVKSYAKSVPLGISMNPYYNKMISLLRGATESVYQGADPKVVLDKAAQEYKTLLVKK